jgi:hypothetical protein
MRGACFASGWIAGRGPLQGFSMDIKDTLFTFVDSPGQFRSNPGAPAQGGDFQSRLPTSQGTRRAEIAGESKGHPAPPPVDRVEFGSRALSGPRAVNTRSAAAAAAYEKQGLSPVASGLAGDIAKYRDDQLLGSPGGDHYDLEKGRYTADPPEQRSFGGRIGKNIKDALGNMRNFAANLLFGAKRHYRDESGAVQEGRRRGLVGSVADFFQDLGSAFSFGAWRPDGEEEPRGFGRRVGFFFSKLKEAIFGDLLQGAAGSVVNMAKDLVFAAWNLLETAPDATIGNFEAGRKLTTAVFDNGQVTLGYIADILPGGDASVRVHSPDLENFKPPILNNLTMPENNPADARWKYVRNTPFRKAIETAGSIITSILTLRILGGFRAFGEKRNQAE